VNRSAQRGLRLAGLASPVRGDIWLGGVAVTGNPPGERRVGLVPAGGGLLPHLTVERNVAFGLAVCRRMIAWIRPVLVPKWQPTAAVLPCPAASPIRRADTAAMPLSANSR
jgi:ABC-type sugar transport system ATPase subunit